MLVSCNVMESRMNSNPNPTIYVKMSVQYTNVNFHESYLESYQMLVVVNHITIEQS